MYKNKKEHGYLKAYEASQGSNDLSLSKIIIKSQQKNFLESKAERSLS